MTAHEVAGGNTSHQQRKITRNPGTNTEMVDSPNDKTMSAKARQVDSDHVKKVLTTHFRVDSANYDEKKSLQVLTHSNRVGIYEDTFLSNNNTGNPDGGTPKKGNEHTEAMSTEDDTQKGITSPYPNDKELAERAFDQGKATPMNSGK